MYRRAIGMSATGIWAIALCAQTPPPQPGEVQLQVTVNPPAPAVIPKTLRMPRLIPRDYSQKEQAVCSIPLLEVPVTKNVERMPTLLPSAGPDNIDHMPTVKLPAPPCQGEKR